MGVPDVFDATSRLIILASLALKDGLVFSLSLSLSIFLLYTPWSIPLHMRGIDQYSSCPGSGSRNKTDFPTAKKDLSSASPTLSWKENAYLFRRRSAQAWGEKDIGLLHTPSSR